MALLTLITGEKEPYMIELTTLTHERFFMNYEQIEIIEEMPDTLITMTTGKKYYCSETAEEVVAKIEEYKKTLCNNCALLNKRQSKITTAINELIEEK